jgi:hypothetical protein
MSDERPEKSRSQFSLTSLIIMMLLTSCILLASIHLGKMLYAKLRETESEPKP